MLSAEKVAAAKTPLVVFHGCGDVAAIKAKRNEYAKALHPDVNPSGSAAFSALNVLYDEAVKLAEAGEWTGTAELRERFVDDVGRTFHVRYLRKRPSDLGVEYVTSRGAFFVVDRKQSGCATNAVLTLSKLVDFLGGSTEFKSMRHYVPQGVPIVMTLENGDLLVFVKRIAGTVALEDLIANQGGHLDPRHVAWVLGCLYNFSCALNEWKITHNGLTTRSVFVDPANHTIQVVGGWFFSARIGSAIKHLPREVHSVVGAKLPASKAATPLVDLESIKLVGRVCLGGVAADAAAVPTAMRNFLLLPAGSDPIAEYGKWEKVRDAAFGVRRFVEMGVTADEVYYCNREGE